MTSCSADAQVTRWCLWDCRDLVSIKDADDWRNVTLAHQVNERSMCGVEQNDIRLKSFEENSHV